MHELAAWHIGIKHHRKFLRNHNAYNDEKWLKFLKHVLFKSNLFNFFLIIVGIYVLELHGNCHFIFDFSRKLNYILYII